MRLYGFQTAHEKAVNRTVLDNDVGFQEMDAKFGGRMARIILRGEQVYASNMPRLKRMAVKYRRQIAYLSFRKEQAKAANADGLCMVLRDDDTWVDERKAA